jgi:hypothetical protein
MKPISVALASLLVAWLAVGAGASPLSEMPVMVRAEWMIGKWATEDGMVGTSYAWRLNKNAVAVTVRIGSQEAEGLFVRKPGSDEVMYGAADNEGGLSTGKLIELNGNPTLVVTHVNVEGKESRVALEHIREGETMTVKIHGLGADGRPEATVKHEVVFKRQR